MNRYRYTMVIVVDVTKEAVAVMRDDDERYLWVDGAGPRICDDKEIM